MQVYALVGPAGTGKSHRAVAVAHDHQIDVIIDDGLLIQGSRILAGRSAKREATRMAAVRRAIFLDEDHRVEVRAAIQKLQPQRILILGTSTNMIDRIVQALELPEPAVIMRIEDIASPEEIRLARRVRRQQGKHVVPAPTFEVKKSFSGYLVDPLRLFHRSKNSRTPLSIEKSVLRPTFSSLGKFFISDGVVAGIVGRSAKEVEGITNVGRVLVQSHPDGITIYLELVVHYGIAIDKTLQQVQRHVRNVVEYMTALNVIQVDVTAKGLSFPDEARERVNGVDRLPALDNRINFDPTDRLAQLDYNEA